MQKRWLKLGGIFISMVGFFFILSNVNITGFAIANITSNIVSYIFPLALVIGGILMAVSGDALQAWLEEKEKRHKSPSLEGKIQTKEEEREFRGRYSGEPTWKDRLFRRRNIEQVPQKETEIINSFFDN